jgi:hypothetical protein
MHNIFLGFKNMDFSDDDTWEHFSACNEFGQKQLPLPTMQNESVHCMAVTMKKYDFPSKPDLSTNNASSTYNREAESENMEDDSSYGPPSVLDTSNEGTLVFLSDDDSLTLSYYDVSVSDSEISEQRKTEDFRRRSMRIVSDSIYDMMLCNPCVPMESLKRQFGKE